MKFLFFGQIYSPFQNAIEVAASTGLRMRGHDVVHIICSPRAFSLCDVFHANSALGLRDYQCKGPCTETQNQLFRFHGAEPYPLNNFWTNVEMDAANQWAVRSGTIQDLTQEQFRGYSLFEIAKWSIYRYLGRRDTVDPNGADRWITVEMMKNAMVLICAAERLLDECQFERVVVWNGLTVSTRAVTEAARRRGIPYFALEHGMLTNTCILSQNATPVPLNYDKEWLDWKNQPLTAEEEAWLIDHLKTRARVRDFPNFYGTEHEIEGAQLLEKLKLPAGTKLVPLYTNMAWDTSAEGVNHVFKDQVEWISETAKFFSAKPDYALIVRVHPGETSNKDLPSQEPLFERIQKLNLPGNFRVLAPDDEIDSYSLAKQASFAITYTSTIGVEMACANKPVVTAAKNHYRRKGFTWDSDAKETYFADLEKMSSNPQCPENAAEFAKRYAYLFLRRASLPLDFMEEPLFACANMLWQRVDDLAPGKFSSLDWIVESLLSQRSFVAPPSSASQFGSRNASVLSKNS